MPVYNTAGAVQVSTPHIVRGTVTLANSNSVTLTLGGSAVFQDTACVCAAADITAGHTNVPVNATPLTASSFSLSNSGNGNKNDTLAYFCIG